MAAPSTKAEDVALYGPEAPSQGIGPWGVIAFTISTDAGKARALGKLAGGESLVAAARLVPAVIPATSNLAFQFRIDPHVIGQADAWRAARASRLDYFLWISHAGPGFISAAEGRTIGAAEIEWMELVPPPPGQTGKEKSERNIRMKKIEESRRKLGKKAEGLRERTVGASIRSYIRLERCVVERFQLRAHGMVSGWKGVAPASSRPARARSSRSTAGPRSPAPARAGHGAAGSYVVASSM